MVEMSTGVPGAHAGRSPPQPLVMTTVVQPGRRGGADAVHDRAHAPALVVVGAGAVDQGAPAGVADGDRPHLPVWPATAAVPKPGTSALSMVARVSPIRSPVWPQPEPSTRATSWRRRPVRSRDDGGGGLGDVEGVGRGVGQVVGGGGVGHAAQRSEAGARTKP